ncbi:DENN domain-containing protein 5B isoform X2 [Nilaparvata lugens]|uniref:DENN domain-containing protein 5B isoform X2 n=1 Tax=Nilaparvata lugens TaxID=108931 RepID=UPI00193E8141|nr:DENN domain-containing protein 5B isoform X2 [Nilaparvata lugens]
MDTNKLKNAGYTNRFADYFVICGLDLSSGLEPDNFAGDNLQQTPLERPYKCKVLGHYPENVSWNPFDFNAVCMLSLPHGLQFHTQKHILEPKFHSFVITKEDGRRTYGSSYVFFEEVSNRKICSAMQTLQAMHWAELSSGQSPATKPRPLDHNTRSLPRHFKLTAHRPKAAQSYYDHAKDTLYVTKSISLISQVPYVHASRLFLSGLYRCWKDQHHISVDSYVYNLLYQVTVPQPGRSLSFHCYPDCTTTIQRPSAIEELPLFDFPLRELFGMLSVESVLQLFTCLQLENQILLCSSEYQKLMLVAESMLCLLFPFTWPHVYVPILPASLQHFLDAPVPFIMGLHSRENRINIPSEANLCYVDLDTKVMQLPEELPSFPQKAEFIAEINDLLCKYKVSCDVDKNSNSLTNSPCCDKPSSGVGGGDIMTTSCTLPSSTWRPRKHSWANDLDEDANHYESSGSDTLRRIISLARKTRVSLEGIGSLDWDGYAEPDVDDNDAEHILDEEGQYTQELLFNNALREIFLNRFVHIFSNYENFVIQPSQDREQWMNERESMQNFDKATFLSDQPQQHQPFLSRFIETQMFATLVDNKIMSAWMKVEPNLRVFERRIKLLRKRYCDGAVRTAHHEACREHRYCDCAVRMSHYEACLSINDSERLLEKRMASVDVEVAAPQELLSNHVTRNTRAGFPLLDSTLLNQELAQRRQRNVSKQLTHSVSSVSLDELDSGCEVAPRQQPPPQHHLKSLPRAKSRSSEAKPLGSATLAPTPSLHPHTTPDMSPALIAQTNWNFVETLLKDCKAKTKRMLVEKMGMEGVELGNTGQTSLVEENTLIASLCDLLERIWSHGLQAKQGKSALWAHLMNFQELEDCDDSNKSIDPNFLTPALAWCVLRRRLDHLSSPAMDRSPLVKSNRSRSETRTSSRQFQSHDESVGQPFLRPLPCSLTYDLRCIQSMAEIKTQIGYARAFVRLSLEKKVLSRHLKTLLADSALLKSQYKRYAFLRCEEEKEQFLYHLLTLNAVDYYCFTNTYTNTRMLYRVAIFPTRKSSASSTTANCWVAVSGSNGETQQLPVPKGALHFTFSHRNLGLLTTLRIGHDNSGLSPKWMVEHVIARNEVTGHTYLFPCGRWLGRGVDDDSTERLLVGEKLAGAGEGGRHPSCSNSGSNSPRVRSPSVPPPRRSLPIADVQHMLGDCLNRIVKYFYRAQAKDGPNSSLTMLLCGENGLVYCLEHVFFHGYKSIRLFGRNLYVWDFIERVKDEKEHNIRRSDIVGYYCHLVDRIQSYSNALGKDGRFQQFVCVSIRDRKLDLCIEHVMADSQAVLDMYEEHSFLRDPNLRMYLTQMLYSLNEFDIVLEKSLTQGISAFR